MKWRIALILGQFTAFFIAAAIIAGGCAGGPDCTSKCVTPCGYCSMGYAAPTSCPDCRDCTRVCEANDAHS